MSVATGEKIDILALEQAFEAGLPLVMAVPEMAGDQLVRDRAAQFMGAIATNSIVEVSPVEKPIESLHDAIQKAARGDLTARLVVEVNARTDVIERTIKAGHVMKVNLLADENGKIQQHGQSLRSIQANSLLFASDMWQMRERVEAETRNAFRIEELYRQGYLEEYSMVVFSRAADNMTDKEMKAAGFFTDTMSCAIQVTTAEDGGLTTESAFVAGVRYTGATRHDADAVVAVGKKLNVNLSGKSAAGVIDTPVLVHNSLIPNGAVDVVKFFDDYVGTFFGQEKPQEDYVEYLQKCLVREQSFKPKVDQIINELISEAPRIKSPVEATKRLHKISEKHMVEQAVQDKTIDPRVFGLEASHHIEMARWHLERGNLMDAEEAMNIAKDTAQSSSCPGIGKDSESNNSGDQENGDCEFVSKKCPECGAKNVKTKVSKISKYAKRISGNCGCSVTVNV